MKRKEKAERIQSMLEELYPETPVPLDHETPFQLLVAVLMSAQTTDLKVNQVTPALFKQGPTPEKMAQLEVATIQSLIRKKSVLLRRKPRTFGDCLNFLSNVIKGTYRIHSKNWKRFQALDTKPLVSFLLKHLTFQRFLLTHISTDLQHDGGSQTGRTSIRLKRTSKRSFQKMHGMTSICKSSFSDENIVLHDTTICLSAQSVHGLQQEANQ